MSVVGEAVARTSGAVRPMRAFLIGAEYAKRGRVPSALAGKVARAEALSGNAVTSLCLECLHFTKLAQLILFLL